MKNTLLLLLSIALLSSCKETGKKNNLSSWRDSLHRINPPLLKLKVGEEKSLSLNSGRTLFATWTSNSPAVAVFPDGKVFALCPGIAVITATEDKSTASCTVEVEPAYVSHVQLDGRRFNLLDSGTITLNNAPRALSANLAAIRVNLQISGDKKSITMDNKDFDPNQKVDFRSPKNFVVTMANEKKINYTLAIAAYHPDSNPYGVYTIRDLNDVRNALSGSFKMMNNIAFPDIDSRDGNAFSATGVFNYHEFGWLPIAHDATVINSSGIQAVNNGFTGIFDGGNFAIKDLYINSSGDFSGLFAVTYKATIKNLNVSMAKQQDKTETITKYAGAIIGFMANSSITNCSSNGNVVTNRSYLSSYAGGLVGYAQGDKNVITNCYTTGNVSKSDFSGGLVGKANGGSINLCYTTGNVSAQNSAGGLVGNTNGGSINLCYTTGNVSAFNSAGGLVGYAQGDKNVITNCYATGNVSQSDFTGGLVGKANGGSISLCYATGNISTPNSDSATYAGGLVGYLQISKNSSGAISKCFATGDVSATASLGDATSGGLVGKNEWTVNHCYATGNVFALSMKSNHSAYAGGFAGFSAAPINHCYATGNISASATRAYAGGFAAAFINLNPFTKCIRNKDAEIETNTVDTTPVDATFSGIEGKTKKEMQEDSFTTYLNNSADVWERNNSKNNGMPTIKGL